MLSLAIAFPAIDPVAIRIGPVAIKWYGLAYVAGLLLGWLYIRSLLSRSSLWGGQGAPLPSERADDLFIWVAIGVVAGGRLGHVLLYEPVYYLTQPWLIPQIWTGGMAFHGGLAGTVVAMWIFARRQGASFLSLADIVAAAVPIGLFFGRIANFINSEVVGTVTTAPWGVPFPPAALWGTDPRHPVQLYEAALEGAATFLILRYLTHRAGALATPGLVGGAFLTAYGAFRIFCEVYKLDEHRAILGDLPVTSGMVYCLPMLLAGPAVIAWARRSARVPA
jgi:phosphatidylglycerol:prolipoprotein diacylglycerol transferase